MLDVHTATTPNGLKIRIFLDELAEAGIALPHRVIPVRLSAREQFQPAFQAISPNGKIPAIVDHDPADGGGLLSIFESGRIHARAATPRAVAGCEDLYAHAHHPEPEETTP